MEDKVMIIKNRLAGKGYKKALKRNAGRILTEVLPVYPGWQPQPIKF